MQRHIKEYHVKMEAATGRDTAMKQRRSKDHRKLKEAGVTIPSEPAEGNLASAVIWDTGF